MPFVHLASEPLLWRVFSSTDENIYEMDKNTRRRKKYLRDEALGELNQIFVQEAICNDEVLEGVITAILYEDFPETAHLDILEAVGLAGSIQIQLKRRDPKFASLIKRAYEDSCAFCGYSGRIEGKLVGVDAAHVKMHSKGGSDEISNGMALCVLHHKLFDRGVMSLDEDYRILISQDFILNQEENAPFVMGLNGKEMRRPQSGYSPPGKENIEWHRSNLFRGPARNWKIKSSQPLSMASPKSSFSAGEIINYREMCDVEKSQLQRGMNFRLSQSHSVLLMSRRDGAPYNDEIIDNGMGLIYEGHDIPKSSVVPYPKSQDQKLLTPKGSLTQNGRFFNAAQDFKSGKRPPERVRVYEKLKVGIWVFAGTFDLVDAWSQESGVREVFKFELKLISDSSIMLGSRLKENDLPMVHTRLIPSQVKQEVFKRDGGQCVECASKDNLHFDHIIPFSKGGSSLTSENIQLLCARHNLQKSDSIQ